MKLTRFEVKNFRSIHEATIKFENNTIVLLGPNNEGKSNLLIALKIAFDFINGNYIGNRHRVPYRRSRLMGYNDSLRFCDDFPVTIFPETNKSIFFGLHFSLTDEECNEIDFSENDLDITIRILEDKRKNEIKSHGNMITDDADNLRYGKIFSFVSRRIFFQYIPAVRTQQQSIEIIQSLVDRELKVIEQNEKYADFISTLKSEQNEKLRSIGNSLTKSLKKFLPTLKNIDVKLEDEDSISRQAFRTSISGDLVLNVNDGIANTLLSKKGDGVISLVTMGLMKQAFTENRDGSCILAIEEPESHLHPAAIHRLKDLLLEMSHQNQIMITTHNPIMVVHPIHANIIVEKHVPHIAHNIEEIRSILGINVSDNLMSAEVVLIVEGEKDKIAMEFLLVKLSNTIKNALENRILIIETLDGGSNLSYKINELKRSVCRYLCVLDNDECGRKAYEKVKDIIKTREILLTPCGKNEESELEDCFNESAYSDLLGKEFSPKIFNSKSFKNKTYNWSKRIQIYCLKRHMFFDAQAESKLKYEVIEAIKKSDNPLNRKGLSFFKSIIEQLTFLLNG